MLDFSMPAILSSMPDYMVAAFDPEIAPRLWTTLLSLNVLESLSVCWATHDTRPSTLVDETETWIANAIARHHRTFAGAALPRSEALFRMSAVPKELTADVIEHARSSARETVLRWKLAHEQRLELHRTSAQGEGGIWRSYRVAGEAAASFQKRHEAASTFLLPMADGLTRVHRSALFVTSLLTALTINTFLYWLQSSSCCSAMRAKLGCSKDPSTPCRGISRDCADLSNLFKALTDANVVHADLSAYGPWAWQCSAPVDPSFVCPVSFPDSSKTADRFYTGLIATGVSLPVHHILAVLLQMSSEAETEDSWLSMQPILHMLVSLLRLRRLGGTWHWRATRPLKLVRYLQRYSVQPFRTVLERLCAATAGLIIRRFGHSAAARETLERVPEEERDEAEEELLKIVAKRVAGVLGLVFLYVLWAVYIFVVLTYGIQLLGLQGVHSEVTFLTSWAVSVAVQSAWQFRYAAQALGMGILSHYLFELVHFAPQHTWFEVWLDSSSVQAACSAAAGGSAKFPIAEYTRRHMHFFRGVAL